MKEIKTKHGYIILVDDEDFEELSKYKWSIDKDGYAYRFGGKMHRLIIRPPANMEIDHINGNRIDNRKSNLRVCTHAQNQCNKSTIGINTSGFKGVAWREDCHKWRAKIKFCGTPINIGHFDNPIDAAIAYDKKALELFGEFAKLNFGRPE